MQITLEVPGDSADTLVSKVKNLPQRSLELLAVDAYCTGTIGAAEVRRMLNLASR